MKYRDGNYGISFIYDGGRGEDYDLEITYASDGTPRVKVVITATVQQEFDLPGTLARAIQHIACALEDMAVINVKAFAGQWGDEIMDLRGYKAKQNGTPQIDDLPF